MSDVVASKEQVERMEAARAQMLEANERRRKIELARASAPKRYTDDDGMTWTYVVMDESFARIDSCKHEKATVLIPKEIAGLPVRALGSDIFNESDVVEEVVCPDTIESIGSCAFRLLSNLRRVVFPGDMATFSGSWVQHCDSLEEMVLPGLLDKIKPAVFDNASLRRLHIGRGLREKEPGAFRNSRLELITLDGENPFLLNDGTALYSADGSVLLAFAREAWEYSVRPGCQRIAKKAFDGHEELKRIELPEGIELIDAFAFTHAGLQSFTAPSTLRVIAEKAFYYCRELQTAGLNDGLVKICDSAFEESGLESLHIPASIEQIGRSVTRATPIKYQDPGSNITIDPASPSLFLDGKGGLYRREEDGIHFIQLMDTEMTEYPVFEGTAFIDERAFALHSCIERVMLPEGVREIRGNAFRVCGSLRRVDFPESLESIGKEAFLDTMLEEIYLPAGFKSLPDDALVTAGAHRLGVPPSLRTITVHEDNESFYVESGLLCRRGEKGDRGIVFNDDVADVVIPDKVTTIAPFAFSNARNIRTFTVGPNLQTIGTSGFATWCYIENIHAEVAEPVEGRHVFDISFPDTPRAVHEISISLGGSAWVNVPDMLRHYDNCLANAHNYHVPSSDDISAYDQVRFMLARLRDPIALAPVNKDVFERIIREHLIEMCVDVARHDDRAVVDELCNFGFLNSDNLEDVIVAVGRLQDAAMSGYLLELKRRRFGRAAFDFDL